MLRMPSVRLLLRKDVSLSRKKKEPLKDAESEAPAKRRRLSLSLKKREPLRATNSWFGSPTKQEVFEVPGEGVVPTPVPIQIG